MNVNNTEAKDHVNNYASIPLGHSIVAASLDIQQQDMYAMVRIPKSGYPINVYHPVYVYHCVVTS